MSFKQIEFSISINAPISKVWQVMWFYQTYKKWTNTFCEGSYYDGEIKQGNDIKFLTPSGNGMYSKVNSLQPNEYIAFEHLGDIKNFELQPKENFAWSGSLERYYYSEENGITTLKAVLDSAPEFEEWFNTVFPKALEVVKTLAENPIEITIETTANATLEKVWEYFTNAQHIEKWYSASEDWHTPKAINNATVNGKFDYRMEAKDGSFGFNFTGTFTQVEHEKLIAFTMDDDRKAIVNFVKQEDNTIKITEIFEAETINNIELQYFGWQAILNNFKKYVEAK